MVRALDCQLSRYLGERATHEMIHSSQITALHIQCHCAVYHPCDRVVIQMFCQSIVVLIRFSCSLYEKIYLTLNKDILQNEEFIRSSKLCSIRVGASYRPPRCKPRAREIISSLDTKVLCDSPRPAEHGRIRAMGVGMHSLSQKPAEYEDAT